jgi:hypothetical protein
MDINIQSYSDPASPHPPRSQLIRIAEKCTRVAACVTSCANRAFFSFRACAYTKPLCFLMHRESSRSAHRVLSFRALNKARTDETDGPCRCRASCLFNIVARSDVRQMRRTAKASCNAHSASCKGCCIKCKYKRRLKSTIGFIQPVIVFIIT